MRKIILQTFFFVSCVLSFSIIAKNYQIYSIMQEISMGEANEKIHKNYFINIGIDQGVKRNTILNVYRNISNLDPFDTKNRYNNHVNIGKLKVIHVDRRTSIAIKKELFSFSNSPLLEIPGFIVGDQVDVDVDVDVDNIDNISE